MFRLTFTAILFLATQAMMLVFMLIAAAVSLAAYVGIGIYVVVKELYLAFKAKRNEMNNYRDL